MLTGAMGAVLYVFVLPLFFIAVMAAVAIRRGQQLNRLLTDGVETAGTVVRKLRFGRSGQRKFRLRYRYIDGAGRAHENRSMVVQTLYDAHEEGGPIAIVYSRSKPHVSAPKDVVEQVRMARTGRRAPEASPR